jgi:ABC-type sugar transport system permease subunit
MGFPWVGGTAVLIYLSGIMNIPNEIREASVLDGAGTLRRIFSIDLPLIKGQIRYFIVFGIISGLQDYSVQIILTEGGPGYTTYVPGYYMFKQAFTSGNMGYACAIGTLLFVLIATLTLITFKSLKTSD